VLEADDMVDVLGSGKAPDVCISASRCIDVCSLGSSLVGYTQS
jgi:hypothetical protein